MRDAVTILKNPALPPAQDYNALRKSGIDLIQQLGSNLWTDYNIHDPGITLLELLCFAITDIGYRESFSIEDLLTTEKGGLAANDQCLYTARRILTNNPWTPNDWRKLIIDMEGVRNAWHICSSCGCGVTLYANCKKSALQYEPTEHTIRIKGFNNVLIELDIDPVAGDLNSGKVFQAMTFMAAGKLTKATLEIRFAPWHLAAQKVDKLAGILKETSFIDGGVKVLSISGNTSQSVDIPAAELYKGLRNALFANIEISFREKNGDPLQTTLLQDVPIKVWYRSDDDRKAVTLALLREVLEDASVTGIANRYFQQLKKAALVMANVTTEVHAHRNLSEDYCDITTLPVCDVALCADIEMRPDADIEKVLGEAYWLIEQYFNPTVPFNSLKQLLERKIPVEEIFNGPALAHGFILNEDLDKAQIRTELHSSDVINILMDIDGITAVKNIALARYNALGKLVESQPWSLKIPEGAQPRLYVHASKVLVFKNDLPFLPDADELNDTLQRWKGQNRQNKLLQPENDLPVPLGRFVNNGSQWPLQNMLPDTYGVGLNGLPEVANAERRGQAKQLKGYLLVLEHLLQVYIQQLLHIKDLLSIDPAVSQTWFANLFKEDQLTGVAALYKPGFTEPALNELLETHPQFVERRNHFLDHLLGRFAENFADYALQTYTAYGSEVKAGEVLINNKINFLQKFPEVSANRAKAFNYKDPALVCNPGNKAGLQERVRLLLGLNGWEGFITLEVTWAQATAWSGFWKLTDTTGNVLIQGNTLTNIASEPALRTQLVNQTQAAIVSLAGAASLTVIPAGTKFRIQLANAAAVPLGTSGLLNAEADATAQIAVIRTFLTSVLQAQKVFVVEHLLLRPRNKPSAAFPTGDPLLPICITPDCRLCGEEDPYSFRITLVLDGEQSFGLANQGIAFRRYAEKAIRMEVPAHLGVKICWVSTANLAVFETLYCDWLSELAKAVPDATALHTKLVALLAMFQQLKSVYPPATLHDCVDGDDENRVYLGQTVI